MCACDMHGVDPYDYNDQNQLLRDSIFHPLTHSEQRPQNIYSQEEINLYCIIKFATEISLFSNYKSAKLDVLCRQNKI